MKNKQIVFNLHTSAMTCGELRIWASWDTQFMLSDQCVNLGIIIRSDFYTSTAKKWNLRFFLLIKNLSHIAQKERYRNSIEHRKNVAETMLAMLNV